jgi:lysophospholipase L1-like esterase
VQRLLSTIVRIVGLGIAILIASFELAFSEPLTGTPAEACLAVNRDLSLGARLPRTSARWKSSERLSIVAVGSSSTVGLWVLRSAATYPEVMRQELVRLRSNAAIEVVNSGRVGDTIEGNVARFQRDVLAHKPDLVVWQLGTNDVAWGGHPDDQLKSKVVQGVQMLKASGADIILMDLQYAPMVLRSPYYSKMEAIIAEVARQEKIGFFSRFALMRKSIEAGVSPNALVSWDGLHHTADGYDCIGRALARSVSNIVR